MTCKRKSQPSSSVALGSRSSQSFVALRSHHRIACIELQQHQRFHWSCLEQHHCTSHSTKVLSQRPRGPSLLPHSCKKHWLFCRMPENAQFFLKDVGRHHSFSWKTLRKTCERRWFFLKDVAISIKRKDYLFFYWKSNVFQEKLMSFARLS